MKLVIPVPVVRTFYVTKEGDTLQSLAKEYYGRSSKWKKIYNANKSLAYASGKVKAGKKLQIPALLYAVKKGDTLKDIAQRYFGAKSKWKLIYEANEDVITSSKKVKEGTNLVIQAPVIRAFYTTKKGDTLQSLAEKYYGTSSKWKMIYNMNKNKATASGTVKAGKELLIPAMTYEVEKGDTIQSIAKQYYGKKSDWRKIYQANRDLIPESKKLKTGVSLVLPVPVDSSQE